MVFKWFKRLNQSKHFYRMLELNLQVWLIAISMWGDCIKRAVRISRFSPHRQGSFHSSWQSSCTCDQSSWPRSRWQCLEAASEWWWTHPFVCSPKTHSRDTSTGRADLTSTRVVSTSTFTVGSTTQVAIVNLILFHCTYHKAIILNLILIISL